MPTFKVLRRVDAFVDYVSDIEAASAEEAAEIARNREVHFRWKESGTHQFDARLFVVIDADGLEVEGTQCGDF